MSEENFQNPMSKILTNIPPEIECGICQKRIKPQEIEIGGEIKYINLNKSICDSCAKRIDEATERERIKKQTDRINIRMKNLERILVNLGVPFPEANASDFQVEDRRMVREIFEGMKQCKNYLVISECGVGKSYYASFIFKKLIKENILYDQYFSYVRLRDFLLKVRNSYEDNQATEMSLINEMSIKKYLFLEIFDHETTIPQRKNPFHSTVLLDLIDVRYRQWKLKEPRMATLFISTLNEKSLNQVYDQSVISRIVEMSDKIFRLSGKNRRHKNKEKKTQVINV